MVPLSIPNFEGNEKKYVADAVDQGWVSTGGAYILRLEQMLTEYLHVENVAACQSGTAAIHLSLLDAGVGAEDMVIVPALTFIAAVNPVKYQFAEPIFMDCDDSLCMDPEKLRKFCEEECEYINSRLIYKKSGKQIKAIVVVHIFGNMADMEQIMDIAEAYGLIVIEDATEALGTYYTEGRYKGRYAGTIGHYGAYSFNGNKIITTGGGGAVTARKAAMVENMKYLSTQAKDDPLFYIHNRVGYNYRMTNLQAALGVAQMEKLPEFIHRKQKNYETYRNLLVDFPMVKLLQFRGGTNANKWFYSLELPVEKLHEDISNIIAGMEECGVQMRAIWGLIPEQKPYSNAIAYRIEKAVYYSKRILNIPCSTQISNEQIQFVVSALKKILGEMSHE